jgi:Holliday junction resolvase
MPIKRKARKPETFDTLELYAALARQQGYRIDVPGDLEAFHAQIAGALKATLANPNILHGKRVEAMFAYVLGALGMCKHIKQEDGGAVFANDDAYEVPDYRVVTLAGELLLVEVKNFHMKLLDARYTIRRSYLAKLAAYAEMNHASLKIALYFSRINKWVLLAPESFLVDGRNAYIDLAHGFARNELSNYGDRMIATLPPLTLQFVGDTDERAAIVQEDGTVAFTIRSVRMYCAGREIRKDLEKNIAFYLMRYGKWGEAETPAEIVDGRLVSISFISNPELPSDDQEFQIVGDLSSMVSTAFGELTANDAGGVVALDVKHDPQVFSVQIPKDYKGDALPLWQFAIEPNFDFQAQPQQKR